MPFNPKHCCLKVVALAALVAATRLLAAPVCVDPERGIGGTGAPGGAIGGTGDLAQGNGGAGPAGGIGGTGQVAEGIGGTGIVGTITGFASVCVNGLEVHYEAGTPVNEDGVASGSERLRLGQVVAIAAGPSPRGLQARRIAILHAVAGPITEVREGEGLVRVMGQSVRVSADTRVAGPRGTPESRGVRVGDLVQVSGFRNARGEVLATRVQRVPDLAQHSVIGHVDGGRAGGANVDGIPLDGLGGRPPSGEALIRGQWRAGRMSVHEIRDEPALSALAGMERVLVEGLVQIDRGTLRVGPFELNVPARAGAELRSDQRIIVGGRLDRERRIAVDHIQVERRIGGPGGRERRGGPGATDAGARDDRASGDERGESENGSGDRSRDDDRSGRQDRSREDRADRNERVERGERPERPERAERPEKVERPERVERPEKVDRPEGGGSGRSH